MGVTINSSVRSLVCLQEYNIISLNYIALGKILYLKDPPETPKEQLHEKVKITSIKLTQ